MQYTSDGFLRLPLDNVLSSRIIHIASGLDNERNIDTKSCGRVTSISGYTEWVSASKPAISLGWDWCLEERYGEVRCVRIGLPRSNVMLIDSKSRDYGWTRNLEILATVVDSISWAEHTRRVIAERYQFGWPTYSKG